MLGLNFLTHMHNTTKQINCKNMKVFLKQCICDDNDEYCRNREHWTRKCNEKNCWRQNPWVKETLSINSRQSECTPMRLI